jgi:glycosyltransferase involved in cell wall biosynthesis
MSRRSVSIVMPAFNEEQALAGTVREVQAQLARAAVGDHEIVIVDDGSSDGTWDVVTTLAKVDDRIRGVRLSRNFGKEAAIATGLDLACCDAAIVMDCDLQHPPELLGDMIATWQRGDAEVVEAFKRTRGRETLTARLFAGVFYTTFERLSGIDLVGASDFKLLDRRVINTYNRLRERNVFFRGLTAWLGFRHAAVHFDVPARTSGGSRWTRAKLVALGVTAILAFSPIPLFFVLGLAAIFFVVSVLLGAWALYLWAIGEAVSGFTTVILLILMSGSMILAGLGVIGLYLAKIYDEVRGRPRSVVSEATFGERTSGPQSSDLRSDDLVVS